LWYDAGGYVSTPRVTPSYGKVTVYDVTGLNISSTSAAQNFDFTALTPVAAAEVAADDWSTIYNGGSFTIGELISGADYAVLLTKKNHTHTVVFGISYAPASPGEILDIGEYHLIAGDMNGDNKIDLSDRNQLNQSLNTKISGAATSLPSDINDDGIVNITDLSLLTYNLNTDYTIPDDYGIIRGYIDYSAK
jgi:hypothetical protein